MEISPTKSRDRKQQQPQPQGHRDTKCKLRDMLISAKNGLGGSFFKFAEPRLFLQLMCKYIYIDHIPVYYPIIPKQVTFTVTRKETAKSPLEHPVLR